MRWLAFLRASQVVSLSENLRSYSSALPRCIITLNRDQSIDPTRIGVFFWDAVEAGESPNFAADCWGLAVGGGPAKAALGGAKGISNAASRRPVLSACPRAGGGARRLTGALRVGLRSIPAAARAGSIRAGPNEAGSGRGSSRTEYALTLGWYEYALISCTCACSGSSALHAPSCGCSSIAGMRGSGGGATENDSGGGPPGSAPVGSQPASEECEEKEVSAAEKVVATVGARTWRWLGGGAAR